MNLSGNASTEIMTSIDTQLQATQPQPALITAQPPDISEMSDAFRPLQISACRQETPDIVCFELRSRSGERLAKFEAGAHIDIEVAPGLIRQYSLLNDPAENDRYVIGVLKDSKSRGGSIAMHQFKTGDTVNIAGPRNHFPLHHGAAPGLLLAGGITPLLAMAQTLNREGRNFRLHYCVRSLSQAAFLSTLKDGPLASSISLHCDDGAVAQRLDLEAVLTAQPPDTHIYVCGPAGFMNWCIETALQSGFSEAQIHREYFKAPETAGQSDQAFNIQLASSGKIFHVPGTASILSVLRDHGIDVPASCETGVCGTCLTGVLGGTPDHRDVYLSAQERAANNIILPCCSRSATPLLILDL
jgi:vanillate O-demethylase ferredoxin subunit